MKRPILNPKDEARAFRIWREGKGVKWDCTIGELASATKIDRHVVGRIVKERRFPVAHGPDTPEHGQRAALIRYATTPVDRAMRSFNLEFAAE
jgi:hypothetical protein